jgi:hypothetical protein
MDAVGIAGEFANKGWFLVSVFNLLSNQHILSTPDAVQLFCLHWSSQLIPVKWVA